MSVYANMSVLDQMTALVEFIGSAPLGAAAEYDIGNEAIRAYAWDLACKGKVALFKRRRDPDAPLQPIMVRISPETARKLGQPDYQAEFTIGRHGK